MWQLVNPVWLAQLFFVAMPWYVNLQILSLAALPFAMRVCRDLPDRGYAFAKMLGLLLATYFTWLLAHGAMRFGQPAIVVALLAIAGVSAASLALARAELVAFLRSRARLIVLFEAIFLLAFLLMLSLRSKVPEITFIINDWSAEKFTDFAVLNSLLTSGHFPPHDAWACGETLNYYYFGHLLWATLIKFGGFPPEIGFNMALATIFALVCIQSFSLGYNVTRRAGWGLLAMFLVAMAGNIDGFWQLVGLAKAWTVDRGEGMHAVPWYMGYEFWRSSRAVANTINEFPAFSFVLGDLHAHLSSFVIYLGGLILLLQMRHSIGRCGSLLRYERQHIDQPILAALIVGALFAANSWDAMTFAVLLAVVTWTARMPAAPRSQPNGTIGFAASRLMTAIESNLFAVIVTLVGVGVFFAFFRRNFIPPFTGNGVAAGAPARLEAPEVWLAWPFAIVKWMAATVASWLDAACARLPFKRVAVSNRSNPVEFTMHWLLMIAWPAAVAALAMRSRWMLRLPAGLPLDDPRRARRFAVTMALVSIPVVLYLLLGGIVATVAFLAIAAIGLLLLTSWQAPGVRLVLGLLLAFCIGTLFCELYYLDDIFDGKLERINTVFKLYYGMWPLLALAAVASLRRIVRMAPRRRRPWIATGCVGALLVLGGAYPVLATLQRAGVRHTMEPPATAREALDGMRYLEWLHPDDWHAIQWIRENVPQDSYLLEAAGRQYEYNGRICTNTGRPALGGWLYHSWAWRGARWIPERNRRLAAAEEIYNTPDPATALAALRANRIEYVVIGQLERASYPAIDEHKFTKFCDEVFREGSTAVYRVRPATDD